MRTAVQRVGLAIIGAAAGTATVFPVPNAVADVTGVGVAVGPEGLRTGCTYTVTATVDEPPSVGGEITIIISGGQVPGNGERLGHAVYRGDGTATFEWTPTYPGRQNLTAQQFRPGRYTSSAYIEVDVVGSGLNTGSSCLPLP